MMTGNPIYKGAATVQKIETLTVASNKVTLKFALKVLKLLL